MISPATYIQSAKYINYLLRYNGNSQSDLLIEDRHYPGLNGESPQLKVFNPKKQNGKVIILFSGASPYAEEHPKMIMLGIVLAKLGYKVYIPRIPPLKNLDISIINVQWIIHFYLWMLDEEKYNSSQISIVGLSYGGALMLKALLNSAFKQNPPNSILTYGTYFDAESTIKFLLSAEISINGKLYYIPPNEWGLVVIFQNYLKNLHLDWDTAGVQEAVVLHIQEKFTERDYQIGKLPYDQKKIIRSVISGKTIPEVKNICHAMILNEKSTFNSLSPKYWSESINQKIFILHGSNDSMVPYTESIQLAEKLNNSDLLISHIFEHKDVVSTNSAFFNAREVYRLIHFFAKFFNHYEN